jgi:hypothetical protein
VRVHVPELVFIRLGETARALRRSKASIITDALVRHLGLEGIPLDPREIYGEEAAERPEIEARKKSKNNS